jgi:hypothetical protein
MKVLKIVWIRARRACIIVGDGSTLSSDPGLASLLRFSTTQGLRCGVEFFNKLLVPS